MPRKSKREIERATEELADIEQQVDADEPEIEVVTVRKTEDGYVDIATGEPVDIDETDIAADFTGEGP